MIQPIPNNTPIYTGISFPPKHSANGSFFDLTSDDELIRNNVYVLLHTRKGEMPMNYDFGNSAYDLLFEPINAITQGLIVDSIKQDIEKWEPRVAVATIKASSLDNMRLFEIVLKYKIGGKAFSVTLPFSST